MSRQTEIATISSDNPYVMLNSEDPDREDPGPVRLLGRREGPL